MAKKNKKKRKKNEGEFGDWIPTYTPEPPVSKTLANGNQLEALNAFGLLTEALDYNWGRVYANDASELLSAHLILEMESLDGAR